MKYFSAFLFAGSMTLFLSGCAVSRLAEKTLEIGVQYRYADMSSIQALYTTDGTVPAYAVANVVSYRKSPALFALYTGILNTRNSNLIPFIPEKTEQTAIHLDRETLDYLTQENGSHPVPELETLKSGSPPCNSFKRISLIPCRKLPAPSVQHLIGTEDRVIDAVPLSVERSPAYWASLIFLTPSAFLLDIPLSAAGTVLLDACMLPAVFCFDLFGKLLGADSRTAAPVFDDSEESED